jgi:hypothetical protein
MPAATFPVRLLLTTPLLLAGAVTTLLATGGRRAVADEPNVVAVVACDGYADLKKQLRWVGTQVGNPALDGFAESFIMMATQFKGLAGLDVGRPAGLVVTAAGGVPAIHGYVPVKDLDRLLAALEGITGPVGREGDVRRIAPPGGMPLDVVERDGWAIFSPRGVELGIANPSAVIGPLAESFTLAAEVFPARMPEGLRKQLEAVIEQAAQVAASQQGQPVDATAIKAALAGLADTESFTIGLKVDTTEERMAIESRTTLVPGSPAAAAWTEAGKFRATVAEAGTSDGKPAAVRGHYVQTLSPTVRAAIQGGLEEGLAQAAGAEDDPVARTVLPLLRDLVSAMLESGGIDARVAVDTSSAGGDRPLPDLTLGMRVKDGAALERRLKERLGKPGGLPPGVAVRFDAGKAGAANLHEITLSMKDVPEAERFGGRVVVTLAVTPDYAFLMVGEGIPARLEAAVGKSGRPDEKADPISGLDVSLAALTAYATRMAEAFSPDAAENAALEVMAKAAAEKPSALVQLLARPIERGLAVRFSVDAGAMRTIAAGVTAQAPAAKPGLPSLPGQVPGRAIPVPSLAP